MPRTINVLTGPERAAALIIGGASGVGAEIAALLAADYPVILTHFACGESAEEQVRAINAAAGHPLRAASFELNPADPASRCDLLLALAAAQVGLSHLVVTSACVESCGQADHAASPLCEGRLALLFELLPLMRPGGSIVCLGRHIADDIDPGSDRARRIAAAGVTFNQVSCQPPGTFAVASDCCSVGAGAATDWTGNWLPGSASPLARKVYRLCGFERSDHCPGGMADAGDGNGQDDERSVFRFSSPLKVPGWQQSSAARWEQFAVPAEWRLAEAGGPAIGIALSAQETSIAGLDGASVRLLKNSTPPMMNPSALSAWIAQVLRDVPKEVPVAIGLPGVVRRQALLACDSMPGLAGWQAADIERPLELSGIGQAAFAGMRVLTGRQAPCLFITADWSISGVLALQSENSAGSDFEPGRAPLSLTSDRFPRRLDDVASGAALCEQLGRGPEGLRQLLVSPDETAAQCLRQAGIVLGRAIGGWINLLVPPQVVVGGFLVGALPYWQGLKLGVALTQMPELDASCRTLRFAQCEQAGVLGALGLAIGKCPEPQDVRSEPLLALAT